MTPLAAAAIRAAHRRRRWLPAVTGRASRCTRYRYRPLPAAAAAMRYRYQPSPALLGNSFIPSKSGPEGLTCLRPRSGASIDQHNSMQMNIWVSILSLQLRLLPMMSWCGLPTRESLVTGQPVRRVCMLRIGIVNDVAFIHAVHQGRAVVPIALSQRFRVTSEVTLKFEDNSRLSDPEPRECS